MSCYRDLTLNTPGPGEHKLTSFSLLCSPKDPTPVPAAAPAGLLYHACQRTHLRHSGRRAREFLSSPGRYSRRARSVEFFVDCNRRPGALTTAAPASGLAPPRGDSLHHPPPPGAPHPPCPPCADA